MGSNPPSEAIAAAPQPQDEGFTPQQLDAFFAAVLVNDVVDDDLTLPAAISLDYDPRQLSRCFAISRQVWAKGVDRGDLRRLIGQLAARRSLAPADQLAFKHIRARFKQLRFAYANFDRDHRYPRAFNRVTVVMGRLQDDLKTGRLAAVGRGAMLLRVLASTPLYDHLGRELDRFRPTSPQDFRAYVLSQVGVVRDTLARPATTGKEFHQVRKIVSRQASVYVSLATLYPTDDHWRVFRYLSAINGLMGGLHDELIARRLDGSQDYHEDRFQFPDDIRWRLAALVARYPLPDANP